MPPSPQKRDFTPKKVVVTLSDDTRRLLRGALDFSSSDDEASRIMELTLDRLCGKFEHDQLLPPEGFKDSETAAKDIRYVMGSLAAEAGHAEDEKGQRYYKKYSGYNNILRNGLEILASQTQMVNMLEELEYQCSMAGIKLGAATHR